MLDDQLMTFRTIVGSKREWEIYGSSRSMQYHDFQFYSTSLLKVSNVTALLLLFLLLILYLRSSLFDNRC